MLSVNPKKNISACDVVVFIFFIEAFTLLPGCSTLQAPPKKLDTN